jgi:hypothetical protein
MPGNSAENGRVSPRRRATRRILRVLLLLLGAAMGEDPASAWGGDTPAPETRVESEGRRGVHFAGAKSDTLAYPWREVLPVASEQLEKDHWQIQQADTSKGRIISRWKPLKHLLARVFLGSVMARVVVDIVPLEASRTAITIRGGLASDGDLKSNPGFHAAQGAYEKAADRWLERVKKAMDARPPDRDRALAVPDEPAPTLNP